jgi:hypothetical protein
MDYEETLLLLDGIVGKFAVVYPAEPVSEGDQPEGFTESVFASGIFRRDHEDEQVSAHARRAMMEASGETGYAEIRPELNLGNAPLEGYERQAAHFSFEGATRGITTNLFAGFSFWRHTFQESSWLSLAARPDWLWIRSTGPLGLVVVAEFDRADEPTE